MKAARGLVFSVMCIFVLSAFGCASSRETYARPTLLPDGRVIAQGGDVGPFGTDNSWAAVLPAKTQPTVQTLEETHHKSSTEWTGCSDEKPNKNAKNIKRLEQHETWSKEVVVGGGSEPIQPLANGANPSTGNLAVPALFGAMGEVGRGMATGGTSIIMKQGGAVANGGNATANGGNANSNSQISNSGNSQSNSNSWSNSQSKSLNKTNVSQGTNVGVGVKVH